MPVLRSDKSNSPVISIVLGPFRSLALVQDILPAEMENWPDPLPPFLNSYRHHGSFPVGAAVSYMVYATMLDVARPSE